MRYKENLNFVISKSKFKVCIEQEELAVYLPLSTRCLVEILKWFIFGEKKIPIQCYLVA